MDHAVLCIDLGSAYTKIGVRRHFDYDADICRFHDSEEDGYLVPSAIAEVRDQLVFGAEAAAQPRGVRRLQNWKRALFAPSESRGTVELHGHSARTLARRFLHFLRTTHCSRLGIDSIPVRICIPKLADAAISEAEIAALANEAGFSCVGISPVVYEPESNALGILTRGRNVTWVPPRLPYSAPSQREPRYQEIFEPEIAARFRSHGLAGSDGQYRLLVVDLGAYTTDFAMVELPVGFGDSDNQRPTVRQSSVDLGITVLDGRINALLPEQAREAIQELTVAEWERLKKTLYQLSEVRLRHEGAAVTLGGHESSLSGEKIEACLTTYADEVIAGQTAFLHSNGLDGVDEVVYTGGGYFIESIARRLRSNGLHNARIVTDLLDRSSDSTTFARSFSSIGKSEADYLRGRELVRTGSAVGGCSVFFH